jgi:dynein heavy chain
MSTRPPLKSKSSERRVSKLSARKASLRRSPTGSSGRLRKKGSRNGSVATFEDEDRLQQTNWVKERIAFLDDYQPSSWDDKQHTQPILVFLTNSWIKTLFAGVVVQKNKHLLVLSVDELPREVESMMEIAYFVRPTDGGAPLLFESISSILQYGTMLAHQTPASAMHMLENVLYPHMSNSRTWPETMSTEINGHYYRLMASLMECKTQVDGNTELYLPELSFEWSLLKKEPSKNRALIQHLECLAEHWRKQLRSLLNFHNDSIVSESDGPLEEIAFWQVRAEEFTRLSAQLDSPDIQRVFETLEAVNSNNLAAVKEVIGQMKSSTLEAEDNMKYLVILKEPCEQLANSDISNMEQIFPTLLNSVRVVAALSSYYNTNERLSRLLRKMSLEIGNRCRIGICVDDLLNGYRVESVSEALLKSIQCCEGWKNVYKRVALTTKRVLNEKSRGLLWAFDEASMFASLDGFIQRCHDLLQICQGFSQFSLNFSKEGSDAYQLIQSLRDTNVKDALLGIKHMFFRQVSDVKKLEYEILNVRNTSWHEDFQSFKIGLQVGLSPLLISTILLAL